MIMGTDIHICPSLLRETGGESGYSPKALKQLSDGKIYLVNYLTGILKIMLVLISSITIANAYPFLESRLSIL